MRQPISLGKGWLKLSFSLLNQIYLPPLISHYLPGEITPVPFLLNSSLEHWSLLLSILLQSEHVWFLKFPWSPQGNIQRVVEAEGQTLDFGSRNELGGWGMVAAAVSFLPVSPWHSLSLSNFNSFLRKVLVKESSLLSAFLCSWKQTQNTRRLISLEQPSIKDRHELISPPVGRIRAMFFSSTVQ